MSRIVKGGLSQCSLSESADKSIDVIKKSMLDKHIGYIEEAGKRGVQILCLQEIFYGPYFCAEQKTKWYQSVEKIPDGRTIKLMQKHARKHQMVIVVPIYEDEMTAVYYNTAAVIDADGSYLGKYRKRIIFRRLIRASGRSSISDPAIWDTRYSIPVTGKWACTFAMTGRRGRARRGSDHGKRLSARAGRAQVALWQLTPLRVRFRPATDAPRAV